MTLDLSISPFLCVQPQFQMLPSNLVEDEQTNFQAPNCEFRPLKHVCKNPISMKVLFNLMSGKEYV